MKPFWKKEKLVATPWEEMKCKNCNHPIPPTGRTFRESLICYKQIIVKYEKPCKGCGKVYTVYG